MKKVFYSILIISLLMILVSCDIDIPGPDEEHIHEYSSTWTYDDTYHYKNCIDETCSSVLKEQHTFNEEGICDKCGFDKNHKEDITQFTVTFKDYDGTIIETQKIEKGKSAIAPIMASTETLKFISWDKDFTNIQSDLEVKAIYEEIIPDKDEYSISFDLNGGSWDYESKDEFILAFLTDFYDFVEPDESLDSFIYDDNNAILGNWKYYIGGSVGELNKLLIDNNIDADDEGYFFNSSKYKAKWYCLSSYVKNQICKSNKRFGEKDYTYGALDFYRYVTNDPNIYIDYYGGNEIFYNFPKQNITIINSYRRGVETELPTPISSLFDYWVNKKGEKVTKITNDTKGDLTLKAVWKEKELFTISFNSNGGNKIDDISLACGDTFDLPTPTKEGFVFIGWYLNNSLYSQTVYSFHKNIGLIAKWRDEKEVPLENLVYDGKNVTYRNSTTVVQIPTEYVQKETQLRACWVSSFAGDFTPSSNQATMKKNLTEVLDIMEAFNMNCVIFHIRTHNQAFYRTKLTNMDTRYGTYDSFGTWDYLKWFIEECHKRNIEFHAWLNPYRLVSSGAKSLEETANKWKDYPNNPASKVENLLMNSDGNVIMNPGIQEVRDFIVDICMEIIENYDVDAIHFDDYFYISGIDGLDTELMNKTNPKNLSLADWRRHQVDLFIEDLSKQMREYNIENDKHVQLGISPSGIYKNGDGTLERGSNSNGYAHYGNPLYSDTYYWIKQGWIDYIMPQIYWGFTLNAAGFAAVADWWNMAVEGTGCNFYAGMGLYMSLSSGNASWGSQPYEVSNQILYTTKLENCKGISFYKWASLKTAYQNSNVISHNGVLRVKNEYWTSYVPTPATMSTNYDYKNVKK